MFAYLKKFEALITNALMVMMALVILLATVELGWFIIKDLLSPPLLILEIDELIDLFGLFLLVLIGIELLESVKTYVLEREIHLEVVLAVAIIALARKVVALDFKETDGITLIGLAGMLLALTVGYYLIRLSREKSRGKST